MPEQPSQAQHLVNPAQQLTAAEAARTPPTEHDIERNWDAFTTIADELRSTPYAHWSLDSRPFNEAVVKLTRHDLQLAIWYELQRQAEALDKQHSAASRPGKRRRPISTAKQAVRAISQVTAQILDGTMDPARGRASIYALQTVLVAIKMLEGGKPAPQTVPQLNASAASDTELPPLIVIGEGGIVEEDDVIIEIIGKRLLAPVDWQAFCEQCNRETPHRAEHDCSLGLIRRCTVCRVQTIAPWTRTTPAA